MDPISQKTAPTTARMMPRVHKIDMPVRKPTTSRMMPSAIMTYLLGRADVLPPERPEPATSPHPGEQEAHADASLGRDPLAEPPVGLLRRGGRVAPPDRTAPDHDPGHGVGPGH